MRTHRSSFAAASLIIGFLVARVAGQALAVSSQTDPPPGELADPIEALMATGGQRIVSGGKTLDFWWVKSLPLTPTSKEIGWSAVEEGTLVGAVKLSAAYPDVRGKTIKPGVYTLRYAIQPHNGDHPGVSTSRNVLLISPADADNSTGALGHDDTLAISKLTLGASQPACWNLDPPDAPNDVPGSTKRNDTGRTAVVFSVAASREGRDVGALKFGLVLTGTVQP